MATRYNLVDDAQYFEVHKNYEPGFSWGGSNAVRFDAGGDLYSFAPVEFVADCTQVEMEGYLAGGAQISVDGGDFVSIDGSATTGFLVLSTGLAAGKHLCRVQFGSNPYINGFRISGGAETMHLVSTTKVPCVSTTGLAYNSTPIQLWGSLDLSSANGRAFTGYPAILECAIVGSGLEVATVLSHYSGWAATINGVQRTGPLNVDGDGTVDNTNDYAEVVASLDSGSHQLSIISLGTHIFRGARVINGTRLASSASISDTTIAVAAVGSLIAVGDWVKIDTYSAREYRRVTGIVGTTLTLHAALAGAHTAGVSVTSYSAPVGSISAWSVDRSARRDVAIGDSNTHAFNIYGFTEVPDADGIYYSAYDTRRSFFYIAGTPLNHELLNLGIQGNDTIQLLARASDINTYSQAGWDRLFVNIGTNDINADTVTPSEYETKLRAILDIGIVSRKPEGRVILMPPGTPQGVTSDKGLNLAGCLAIMQAIAADATYSAFTDVATGALAGLNLTPYDASTNPTGDLDGILHYLPRGQDKIALNMAPYFVDAPVGNVTHSIGSFGLSGGAQLGAEGFN